MAIDDNTKRKVAALAILTAMIAVSVAAAEEEVAGRLTNSSEGR